MLQGGRESGHRSGRRPSVHLLGPGSAQVPAQQSAPVLDSRPARGPLFSWQGSGGDGRKGERGMVAVELCPALGAKRRASPRGVAGARLQAPRREHCPCGVEVDRTEGHAIASDVGRLELHGAGRRVHGGQRVEQAEGETDRVCVRRHGRSVAPHKRAVRDSFDACKGRLCLKVSKGAKGRRCVADHLPGCDQERSRPQSSPGPSGPRDPRGVACVHPGASLHNAPSVMGPPSAPRSSLPVARFYVGHGRQSRNGVGTRRVPLKSSRKIA